MPATAKIRSSVIIHPKEWNSLLFMNDPFPVLLGTDSRTGKYKLNVLDRIAAQPKLKARYHSPSPAFTKLPTSAKFTPSEDRKTLKNRLDLAPECLPTQFATLMATYTRLCSLRVLARAGGKGRELTVGCRCVYVNRRLFSSRRSEEHTSELQSLRHL